MSILTSAQFEHTVVTDSEAKMISGWIIDSWVEPSRAKSPQQADRIVLQIRPMQPGPRLLQVEVDPALLPDPYWFADLRENLCHQLGVELTVETSYDLDYRAVRLVLDGPAGC